MGQKREYRSAVRSRRLIREAFEELLKEKPFEKITVTDIVNRADINRSTFYAHYPDVKGLVNEIMNKAIDDSIQIIENMSILDIFRDPSLFLQGLSSLGTENSELYRLMGKSDYALKQVEAIKTILLQRALSAVDIPEEIRESPIFQIHIHFFIGGILNIYQQWINGTLCCSSSQITDQIGKLIQNNADTYLNWK